jgi:hypothetical protein
MTGSFDNSGSSKQHAWIYVAALFLLLISVLRGLRFPNAWSYSQFLFSYDGGFIKRALAGEIARAINGSTIVSYEAFFYFSASILLINLLLIALYVRDLALSKSIFLKCSSLIFASSSAVVMLSHTMGYAEHLGLLFTLIILRIPGFYRRLVLTGLAMPVLMLVHEAIFPIFFPVIFISLLLDLNFKKLDMYQALALAVVCILLSLLVFFISASVPQPDEARILFQNAQAAIDTLNLREDAFLSQSSTIQENFQTMRLLWDIELYWTEFFRVLQVTLPAIGFLVMSSIRLLELQARGYCLMVLAALASLSPWILNLVASDFNRWFTLSITTSFLVACTIASKYQGRHEKTPGYVIIPAVAIVVVFLNANSTILLFDGHTQRSFPFVEHVSYVMDVIRGLQPFPVIPSS